MTETQYMDLDNARLTHRVIFPSNTTVRLK